uniref:MAGE domain-containing protein n=1 Tax=Castor canadensis TaxID=51338 RepID=A0A8C0ZNR0_CASCN
TESCSSIQLCNLRKEDSGHRQGGELPPGVKGRMKGTCAPYQRGTFSHGQFSGLSQDSQRAGSSFSAVASTSWSHSGKGSSKQRKEGSSTLQAPPEIESSPRNEIDEKVTDLVHFLLFKYKMKEPTTKAEMLSSSIQNYQGSFSVIFSEACECMQIVFGIDLKEVDPTEQSYLLVTSLGLTYDGMQSDVQGMPKTGLLIFILSLIFMKGSCVSEESVWETLSKIGVFDGKQHCIYGDPRKLITEDFVQEQYMEYRQVPNSDPALYEFLWGPRTHAETSKMKVLEFLANIIGSDPSSFPVWYEEALRDEKERMKNKNTDFDSLITFCLSF